MTLEDLSAAWQRLRTATLGRSGFDRHVSELLAKRIEKSYGAWRGWYERANAVDDAAGSLGGAEPHIAELRRLAAAAEAEGVKVDTGLPETLSEQLDRWGTNTFALAVVGLVAWLIWGRKKKGGRRG